MRKPKVSRRKIGSKPRSSIWRQIISKAVRELREMEDDAWKKDVAEALRSYSKMLSEQSDYRVVERQTINGKEILLVARTL